MVKITLELDMPDEATLFKKSWVGDYINKIIISSVCLSWECEESEEV